MLVSHKSLNLVLLHRNQSHLQRIGNYQASDKCLNVIVTYKQLWRRAASILNLIDDILVVLRTCFGRAHCITTIKDLSWTCINEFVSIHASNSNIYCYTHRVRWCNSDNYGKDQIGCIKCYFLFLVKSNTLIICYM